MGLDLYARGHKWSQTKLQRTGQKILEVGEWVGQGREGMGPPFLSWALGKGWIDQFSIFRNNIICTKAKKSNRKSKQSSVEMFQIILNSFNTLVLKNTKWPTFEVD